MQVIVAGFGNVLRGDDGFGVVVARRLLDGVVPDDVNVLEIGIGGIHLVQELLDGVDVLVVVDALDLGRQPGTVLVLDPERVDPAAMEPAQRRDALADMHYATPERAFLLATGLGVLPEVTRVVGCQVADADRLGEGLSPEVEASVATAVEEVRRVVGELGITWTAGGDED